jgi:hypothetical protein
MTLHHFQFLHPLHFRFPLSIIIMVDHATIDIVQSQFMSPGVVQMTWTAVPDLLLSHYESPIDDKGGGHHTNKKDTHFGKCGLGLPSGVVLGSPVPRLQKD